MSEYRSTRTTLFKMNTSTEVVIVGSTKPQMLPSNHQIQPRKQQSLPILFCYEEGFVD